MRSSIRSCCLTALVILGAILSVPACAAEQLKGFYSGSGGISAEVHRVVLVEFAADGTAILQQTWQGRDPQSWNAHWTQDRKLVKITFDAVKDKPTPQPLILNIKHGTLIPTSWDVTALGPLGPPNLAPFGGKNIKKSSVAACQSLNPADPTQNCITWDSRR